MTGSFWLQIWKYRPNLSPKKLFWSWWRQRWRNGETLNIAHYIHVYFTQWIFQLWCKISETNAMHNKMSLNITYIENFSLRIYLQSWLWYLYSKFQICLLCSTFYFIASDTKLVTIEEQDKGYVSWKCQRNRPSDCWDTALWIWLAGVVCSAQHGLLTHWTCLLTRLDKNRSHG